MVKLKRRLWLVPVCCILMLALCACSRARDRKEIEKYGGEVLRKGLAEYYGMEEGSYTATIEDVFLAEGPNQGIVWKITSGTEEFTVFSNGDENGSTNYFWSDRYYDAFAQYAQSRISEKIDDSKVIAGSDYTVALSLKGDSNNCQNKLKEGVTPEKFEEYYNKLLEHRYDAEGFAVTVDYCAPEGEDLSEDIIRSLQKEIPAYYITFRRFRNAEETADPEMVREKYILQYNYTDKMEFVHNR